MNRIKEKYKLCTNITQDKFNKAGFKHHIYKCDLYKNLITILITIEPESDWWTYQVLDADTNSLYIPYYNRLTGKNDLVTKIDRKVNNIFRNLEAYEIFTKER